MKLIKEEVEWVGTPGKTEPKIRTVKKFLGITISKGEPRYHPFAEEQRKVAGVYDGTKHPRGEAYELARGEQTLTERQKERIRGIETKHQLVMLELKALALDISEKTRSKEAKALREKLLEIVGSSRASVYPHDIEDALVGGTPAPKGTTKVIREWDKRFLTDGMFDRSKFDKFLDEERAKAEAIDEEMRKKHGTSKKAMAKSDAEKFKQKVDEITE